LPIDIGLKGLALSRTTDLIAIVDFIATIIIIAVPILITDGYLDGIETICTRIIVPLITGCQCPPSIKRYKCAFRIGGKR
jgi:hypothetical protein